MQKIVLLTFSLLLSFSAFGQSVATDIRNYDNFKKGTTYFLLSDNEELNELLKSRVEKDWKVNAYAFLSKNKLKSKVGDGAFFVDIFTVSFERTGGSTGALHMNYEVTKMLLFQDMKVTKRESTPTGILANIQLNEDTEAEITYGIQMMNNVLEEVLELNTKKRMDLKDFLDIITEDTRAEIKKKTLYLVQEDLKEDVNTKESIKQLYDHKFEFVSREDIQNAVITQREEIAIPRS